MALMHVDCFSKVLNLAVNVEVILPQRAVSQIGMAAPDRGGKHPVLWLLHGASDDETIWQRRTSIERYAARYGLAVVMPAAQLSSYANMAHGGRYHDYIAYELPELMRSFFPLSSRREDNFISGLSMGGFGCMKLGLAHPEAYAAIGCLSAGIAPVFPLPAASDPRRARWDAMVTGGRDLRGTQEDAFASARRILRENQPAPRIYHACGSEDFLLGSARMTRDFFLQIPENPFGYVYEENPGAHTWEFWDEHIQHFLRFIGLDEADDIKN